MQNSWIVLLPPLLVLISVFITRRLNTSLLIGIISAAFLVKDFNFIDAFSLATHRLINQLIDLDYLYLYSFLIILGMIITLIGHTGGAHAFAKAVSKKVKSRIAVENASMILSTFLFIDDYLSTLTTGYVMHPITDQFKIPRAKLAFLVHSMSGPIVIIATVSSWVAMITSQLTAAGIDLVAGSNTKILADPFFIYLSSIPFIFYSFFIIFSVWAIVRFGLSFGPMKTQEEIARRDNNLFGGKQPLTHVLHISPTGNERLANLIFPLFLLIFSVFSGILYAGNYWLFGGTKSFLHALQNNHHTFLVLLCAAAITFIVSAAWSIMRKVLAPPQLFFIMKQGVQLMYPAVIMVFLASTLGTILKDDLLVGGYLAHTLLGTITIHFLPLTFFLVSFLIATIIGSSWGTIAILLPITIQMLTRFLDVAIPAHPEYIPILFPVLGAIFSGAVCGDHISPISETTIMASTSSGAYPLDHAYTQFPYALPAIISCCFGYFLVGILIPYSTPIRIGVPLVLGIGLCALILYIADWFYSSKQERLS